MGRAWMADMVAGKYHDIADSVAAAFGRKYATLTGRGAGAIAIALRALLKPGDRVAVPSICCLSPVNVVSSVGMQPVICDCDPVDLNITPESVEAALNARCRAVIAVHIFGKPCRIGEISELCRAHSGFLLDDACQAAGTMIDGKPAGSFGDVGIVSFGQGKIIPGVIGGGAAVTDDPEIYSRLQPLAGALPEKNPDIDTRARQHRDIATAIQNAARPRPSLAPSYAEIRERFFGIFEHKLSREAAERIRGGMDALPAEVKARRERSRAYRELLEHRLITHIPENPGQAVFRHTFFAGPEGDGGRTARRVVRGLRQGGVHASQHYFPTHLLIPEYALRRDFRCTDAAMRAVNLWVDDVADEEYIRRSVRIIEEALEE